MQLRDAIKTRIYYFLHRKGYSSLWDLYKLTGVPKSTINNFFGDSTTKIFGLPTLLHICEGLGITLVEFFNDPIFLDIEDSSEDQNETKK